MSPRLSLAVQTLSALVLLCAASTAFADAAEARKHYQKGVTAYNLQRFSVALEEFRAAYTEKQDPVFLYNIGQTQRNLGQYEAAAKSYRAFLNQASDISPTQRSEVEQLVKQMDDAARDERARQPPTGTKSPESVSQPAAQPVQQQQASPAVAPPLEARKPEREGSGRALRIAGISIAAFGVASVVAGGAFYAVAKSANESLNNPSSGYYSSSTETRRDTFQTLDIVSFAVGGVAAATGAALYVTGWRRDHLLRLTADAGPGHVGVVLSFNY